MMCIQGLFSELPDIRVCRQWKFQTLSSNNVVVFGIYVEVSEQQNVLSLETGDAQSLLKMVEEVFEVWWSIYATHKQLFDF